MVSYQGRQLDFGNVRRMSMREAVGDNSLSGHELVAAFEAKVEPTLIQPTIIYDYPVEVSPLSKNKPDDPALVERFEIYAAGMEIGNAYTELNDPQEQRRSVSKCNWSMPRRGDEEAHQMDEDYIRAMSYGMPPTGGEGIGIDRLTMILTDSEVDPRRDSVPAAAPGRRDRHCRQDWRKLRPGASSRNSPCSNSSLPDAICEPKRKQAMISIITVISVAGVAAGVMALVIALAINNGFRDTLQRNLLGATAHVSVLEKEPSEGIDNWQQIAARLSQLPHVASALPSLYDSGYISGPVNGAGAVIKGISIGESSAVPDALRHLKAGSLADMAAKPGELPGILLGSRLADSIGAVTGKPVSLIIPNGQMTPFGMRPSFVRVRVAGIFESGLYDLDNLWTFMALPDAQKAFGLSDVVNSIELKLDGIYQASSVAQAASSAIGPKLAATTWQEQNRQLLNALKMERTVTVITIGLIQIVAALNILITLIMLVMEKHRDIAVLMSMGARTRQIQRIFVLEGALIGAVGTRDRPGGGVQPLLFRQSLSLVEARRAGLLALVCAV